MINNAIIKITLLLSFLLTSSMLLSQDDQHKVWCIINCDPDIHTENKDYLYSHLGSDSIMQEAFALSSIEFPIRFAFITEDTTTFTPPDNAFLDGVINNLNYAYRNTGIEFNNHEVIKIASDIKLEDLSANAYELYDKFSAANDIDDMITIYVADYARDFCRTTETTISCSRVGGFSYVLSTRTNNLVLSLFDLKNPIIVAHEFGHFFGLYHTFEEHLFGRDRFDEEQCHETGDLICDTPPDPGTAYEIYVNYATCEMIGYEDNNGNTYQPIVNNYMAYYKPCYLQEYIFTTQQELVVRISSRLQIRKKFSR